jgi:hypothetical protein
MKHRAPGPVRVLAIFAIAVAGCSLVMERPPDTVPRSYPTCTDSATAPLLDVGAAILAGTLVLLIRTDFADEDPQEDPDQWKSEVGIGAWAAVHAVAAGFGFHWRTGCADMRAEWKRRQLRDAGRVSPAMR